MRRRVAATILACGVLHSLDAPAQNPAQGQAQTPLQMPAPSTQLERVTLQQAVERALVRNPSAVAAAADIHRAMALVREARATSLPVLSAGAVITRLDDDRVFGNRIVAAANQQSANITLTLPLVAPQRWAAWSHASDNVDISRASAQDVRRQVAVSTARAYLTVVSQHRIVEVSQRAVTTAHAHYQFAKTQLEGGVGTKIDQVRAEQELATSENQLQLAHVAVVRAQEALGVLLGSSSPVDAVEDVSLPSPPSAVTAAMDDATSLRADVQVSRQRVRASERVLNDSWTDFMPLLVGTVQPFYQNPPSMVYPTWGWQAQLILTVPLYDGGLRYGQADERRALVESARAQQEGILRQVRADVRAAFEAVQRADDAHQAARRAAQLARQALELANIAYGAGATTNLEVIDAERRARDAETSAVISEDGARQARLDLLAASGRFP